MCAYCGKTERLGARWGAGTTDVHGRVFCTLECAWMALFIDEHRANTAVAPTTAAAICDVAEPVQTCGTRKTKRSKNRPQRPSACDNNWNALFAMTALLGE